VLVTTFVFFVFYAIPVYCKIILMLVRAYLKLFCPAAQKEGIYNTFLLTLVWPISLRLLHGLEPWG